MVCRKCVQFLSVPEEIAYHGYSINKPPSLRKIWKIGHLLLSFLWLMIRGEQFLKKEGRDEKDSESGKKESRLMIENDKEEN